MQSLESTRLILSPTDPAELPDLLRVYQSNPDFLAMQEGSQGAAGHYELAMLQRDWQIAQMMPGRIMLTIRLRASRAVVGLADFLAEHPDDGHPWLGALILAASYQRQGLGTEAFHLLAEQMRTQTGSEALRTAVARQNQPALMFLKRAGCVQTGSTPSGDALLLEYHFA